MNFCDVDEKDSHLLDLIDVESASNSTDLIRRYNNNASNWQNDDQEIGVRDPLIPNRDHFELMDLSNPSIPLRAQDIYDSAPTVHQRSHNNNNPASGDSSSGQCYDSACISAPPFPNNYPNSRDNIQENFRQETNLNEDFTNIQIPASYTVSSSYHTTSPQSKKYPNEIKKTLVALLFTAFNFLLTCVSLAFVHEDRPLTSPLPDQVLDRIHYKEWALYGSEYLISIQMTTVGVVVFFHKHRLIVLRRILLIVGCLYFYRAITMWVTVLPAPDPKYKCAPKFDDFLTFREVTKRVFTIMTDTPKSMVLLHWATWINALTAIVLLLLSRGHYTVDVILAYFFATRLWSIYHTICGHASLKQSTPGNHWSRFWWFRAFLWFERNVRPGPLPNEYSVPGIFQRLLAKINNKYPRGGSKVKYHRVGGRKKSKTTLSP
ncbi:phosphatidylcholine:ceramide cholinephosphotransferase 2-like isoform X2 [Tigriopus californicus]|uniref:phosphatidylcholine:ceramide cholinephosphotransferase 2-like isoform X2 n=1 Tax=Tigriopus californicus TaxID=6832 RepID=UPI0027DA9B75|nr:phosphatidylcholine:ceramide cholinephosphotransferase 2-like isoform X2 [Tigriopus californicus]